MRHRARWFPLLIGLGLALVLAGAWWGGVFVPGSGPDPLDEARSAYDLGNFDRAALLSRDRLREDREDRGATRLLARCYARLGDAPSARRLFGQLDHDELEAEDLILLGMILRREGRRAGALSAFELAEIRDPEHAETLANLAEMALEDRHHEEASRYAERLESQAGWEALGATILGIARAELLDPEGAARAIGRALRRDPELSRGPIGPAEAHSLLVRCLLDAGRGEDASRALDRLDGEDPESLWLGSRAALQAGDIGNATEASVRAFASGFEHDPMRTEPAPFVGSSRCVECHGAIARDQRSSRHANTFHAAPDLDAMPVPDDPIPDPLLPGVVHRVRREGEELVVETESPEGRWRSVVDRLMGSGHHGLTPLGIDEQGRMIELRVSHYGESVGWDLTTGHPTTPEAPLGHHGLALSPFEQRQCLSCHTTHPGQAASRSGPTVGDGAIGCERCHGPGGNHLLAVDLGFPDPAIARPRLATSERVVALCGECHRPPHDGPLPESSDPSAVRFQAATFVRSPCYSQSLGRSKFDCVSCHDPHRNVETDPRHYEATCLSCHSPPPATPDLPPMSPPCPVNAQEGCISCHMPRRPSTMVHTPFTDHHIRVQADLND